MYSDALSRFPSPVVFLGALLLAVYLWSLVSWRARTRGLPFPPGPRPLPFLGNMFNIPVSKAWYGFQRLFAEYGDVVHFRVLNQSIVVLGSPDACSEYLDKRSSYTSSRMQSPMIELTGSKFNFGLMPYGSQWRKHRRAFWQHFNESAILTHRTIQRSVAHIFLEKLLVDPSKVSEHVQFTFGASVLKIVYGIDAKEEGDEYLKANHAALDAVSQGMVPGKFMVQFFPFLRHIPTWFPGAYSQRQWAEWQAANAKAQDMPFAFVQENQDKAAVHCSMVGTLLNELDSSEDESEDNLIKNVSSVTFQGGADTTFSALNGAFLALSLHPRVVKHAQAELDVVVGPHRLPDFEDEDSLVYVKAIVLEALRWHSVIPLCMPHYTTSDDEIRGCFIPAGTMIMPNIWACMHDPLAYPEPDQFRPERFIRDGKIDPSIRSPLDFAFGFGRRICPGRHSAQAGLFIHIASVLHVFDIGPPKDEHGKPIHVKYEMTDGILSYPVDSRCAITPRSPEAIALIHAHAAAARAGQE